MARANRAELEDWLSKVDDVSSAIQDLKTGKLDEQKYQEVIQRTTTLSEEEKEQKRLFEVEQRKQEDKRMWLAGRPGKGTTEDFDLFCERCHLEFQEESKQCAKCDGSLVTRADRKKYLDAKVQVLVEAKRRRMERRARFQELKNSKKDKSKKNLRATDYESWDLWEASSEEEEDDVPPPDNPAFAAMAKDIEERAERRRAKASEADSYKDNGNAAYKSGDWKQAVTWYSKSIETLKDNKIYYINRAAANLKLNNFAEARKDCNTAMDIFEILESGLKKRSDSNIKFALKIYLRRAAALRGLNEFDAARSDMEDALKKSPGHKECQKILDQIKLDVEEHKRAELVVRHQENESSEEASAEATNEEYSSEIQASSNDFPVMKALLEELRKILGNKAKKATEDTDKTTSRVKEVLKKLQTLTAKADCNRIYFREQQGFQHVGKILLRANSVENEFDKNALVHYKGVLGDCLEVFAATCDNDHNKEMFVRKNCLDGILKILNLPYNAVTERALLLLSVVTEHEAARLTLAGSEASAIRTCTMVVKLLESSYYATVDTKASQMCQAYAATILCNCAFEPRFKPKLRNLKTPVFTFLFPLIDFSSKANFILLSKALGALSNLLTDTYIRKSFVQYCLKTNSPDQHKETTHRHIIKESASCLSKAFARIRKSNFNVKYSEGVLVEKISAILVNCCVEELVPGDIYERKPQLIESLIAVLLPRPKARGLTPVMRERSAALLARLIRVEKARKDFTSKGGVDTMASLLVDLFQPLPSNQSKLSESAYEHASRAIAQCAKDKKVAGKLMDLRLKLNDGQQTISCPELLIKLLSWRQNPQITGNVALIISSLSQQERVADKFEEGIPALVELMKQAGSSPAAASAAKNAAIACARLAKHPPNLMFLRNNRGLELMSSVSKK